MWHHANDIDYAVYSCCAAICLESTDSLQWRHNGRDCVLNYRRLDCVFNRLFRRSWKKTSKLRMTGLCEGNSPVTGGFPAQRASKADNGSILWRHRVFLYPAGMLALKQTSSWLYLQTANRIISMPFLSLWWYFITCDINVTYRIWIRNWLTSVDWSITNDTTAVQLYIFQWSRM